MACSAIANRMDPSDAGPKLEARQPRPLPKVPPITDTTACAEFVERNHRPRLLPSFFHWHLWSHAPLVLRERSG